MPHRNLAGRIRETALALFTEHGYHGTSMQRIADALGVTRSAFYHHYSSKQDLVAAIAEPLVVDIEALATRAETEPVPVEDLLGNYLDVLLVHGPVTRFVANDPAVQADGDIGRRAREAVTRLSAALAARLGTTDAEVRVACALGAAGGGAVHVAGSPGAARDAILASSLAALDPGAGQVAGATTALAPPSSPASRRR